MHLLFCGQTIKSEIVFIQWVGVLLLRAIALAGYGPLVASTGSKYNSTKTKCVDCYRRPKLTGIRVNRIPCILAINSKFIPKAQDRMCATTNKIKNLNPFTLQMVVALMVVLMLVPVSTRAMEVQEFDGSIVRLDEQIGDGKWLLVMLWATDCHICKQQKPEISRFHDQHKDEDARVVGIALDGMGAVDEVKSYLDVHQVSFPNYVGELAIVASHYLVLTEENLRGTPTYLLFNPDGELMGNNPGPLSVDAIEKFIARKSAG